MAKRNDQAGAEDKAPVKSPTEWTPEGLGTRHDARRQERRELEAELAEIDGSIRTAIQNGDVEGLGRFTARKVELPGLFLAASLAETNARHELANAEDAANLERLNEAETRRDALRKALAEREAEFKKELAARAAELQQVENELGAALSHIASARAEGASNDAGFHRSLAKLAGV